MFRRLFAAAVMVALAGCSHHAQSGTMTATSPSGAATPSGANSAAGMNGSTTGGSIATGAGQPAGFDTESAAQAHCASDQVVWLNTKTRVYHEKGKAYYGRTKQGAYVCRKEADGAGDRDSKNGS